MAGSSGKERQHGGDSKKKKKKLKEKAASAREAGDVGRAEALERLQEQHDYVVCGPDLNYHTTVPRSANVYMPSGVDNAWDFEEFVRSFRVDMRSIEGNDAEFDMVGLDPSLANALRRILIAEVPTMAIEHVFFINNTSIMPDEMLAHRLGLVPLRADPRMFSFKASGEAPNEKNTVVFKLDVACSREYGTGAMLGEKVTSGMLEWLPMGSEMPEETSVRFASSQRELLEATASGGDEASCSAVHDDILLMRLRPGQVIQLEAHATKGIGREHAKWSPVATAWYKLLPEVLLRQPITGEDADRLAGELPGLVTVQGAGAGRRAVVGDARQHEKLLEKARRLFGEDPWSRSLQLRKRKDHFCFTVQSTGVLPPTTLVEEAIVQLAEKCEALLERL